jgi:hypothetical protein
MQNIFKSFSNLYILLSQHNFLCFKKYVTRRSDVRKLEMRGISAIKHPTYIDLQLYRLCTVSCSAYKIMFPYRAFLSCLAHTCSTALETYNRLSQKVTLLLIT